MWEEQYKVIARQNLEARKLAIEKQNALYRPSDAMKEILVIDSEARIKENENYENVEQYKRFKIEEDYDMNEENKEEEEIIYGTKFCILYFLYDFIFLFFKK